MSVGFMKFVKHKLYCFITTHWKNKVATPAKIKLPIVEKNVLFDVILELYLEAADTVVVTQRSRCGRVIKCVSIRQ